jgi:AraC-like DNA-binding protein
MKKEKLNFPDDLPGRVWQTLNPRVMPMPHCHEELELNLVMNGRGRYLVGNRQYELGPRSLLFLFPDQPHILLRSSSNFRMWIAVFRRSLLDTTVLNPANRVLLEDNPQGHFCRVISPEDQSFLGHLASRLSARHEEDAHRAGLSFLLLESLHAFANSAVEHDYTDIHPAVENAIRIMNEGGIEEDAATLGQEAGLSRSHLSRLFHKQTGMKLVEYRNHLRLEKFFKLYSEQGADRTNMLSAAMLAGFGSYGQFFRVFREITGRAPQAYFKKNDPPETR